MGEGKGAGHRKLWHHATVKKHLNFLFLHYNELEAIDVQYTCILMHVPVRNKHIIVSIIKSIKSFGRTMTINN